ncbi:MAG: hypothetical protein ACFE9Q_06550 [Candidatus Hodarchaeota archaeon]
MVRLILKIFIIILALSVTVVTILGGLSAVIILNPNSKNIGIDYYNASFDVDFNNSTGDLTVFNFTLPFNVTNAGYFDLEDLQLDIDIAVRYEHINYTGDGLNYTRFLKYFEKQQNFGNIRKGTIGFFNYTGNISDIIFFPNALTEINWFRTPLPDLEFFANFTIDLTYSLGLHSLSFSLLNIAIGNYSLF